MANNSTQDVSAPVEQLDTRSRHKDGEDGEEEPNSQSEIKKIEGVIYL